MIPDGQSVLKIFGSVSTALALGRPVYRIARAFAWDIIMDHVRAHTADFVKTKTRHFTEEKIGLRLENHDDHLAVKFHEKEYKLYRHGKPKPPRHDETKTLSYVQLPGERAVMARAGISFYD